MRRLPPASITPLPPFSRSAAPAGLPWVRSFERVRGRPARWSEVSGARGFTLVELMVVVIIVALVATIAVPSAVERMRERRSQEAAQKIAAIYRNARIRAMGRGAAVLVRYTTTKGFQILEATRGGASGCAREPFRSCVTNGTEDLWSTSQAQPAMADFDPTRRSEYSNLTVNAVSSTTSSAPDSYLDVCFTPIGKAYFRNAAAPQPLMPMVGVVTFDVKRGNNGLKRTVTVLPNGTSRLGL
ncbi:MAG TPA: prepilin-type N-terminal cleavage/methylation domain-containing protein [Polyangiaceae bacterium]|nr:prepilin-type N-terminal cleavage/methylation domain-containing protein [Polyangiaceae bacterium]